MTRRYAELTPAELVAEVRRLGWDVTKYKRALKFTCPQPPDLPGPLVVAIFHQRYGIRALLTMEEQEKPVESMMKGVR